MMYTHPHREVTQAEIERKRAEKIPDIRRRLIIPRATKRKLTDPNKHFYFFYDGDDQAVVDALRNTMKIEPSVKSKETVFQLITEMNKKTPSCSVAALTNLEKQANEPQTITMYVENKKQEIKGIIAVTLLWDHVNLQWNDTVFDIRGICCKLQANKEKAMLLQHVIDLGQLLDKQKIVAYVHRLSVEPYENLGFRSINNDGTIHKMMYYYAEQLVDTSKLSASVRDRLLFKDKSLTPEGMSTALKTRDETTSATADPTKVVYFFYTGTNANYADILRNKLKFEPSLKTKSTIKKAIHNFSSKVQDRTSTLNFCRNRIEIEYIADAIDYEKNITFYMEDTKQTIVGAISFIIQDGYLFVDVICTPYIEVDGKPASGNGKILLKGVLDFGRKIGMKYVRLNALKAAVPFYKKMGFKIDADAAEDEDYIAYGSVDMLYIYADNHKRKTAKADRTPGLKQSNDATVQSVLKSVSVSDNDSGTSPKTTPSLRKLTQKMRSI